MRSNREPNLPLPPLFPHSLFSVPFSLYERNILPLSSPLSSFFLFLQGKHPITKVALFRRSNWTDRGTDACLSLDLSSTTILSLDKRKEWKREKRRRRKKKEGKDKKRCKRGLGCVKMMKWRKKKTTVSLRFYLLFNYFTTFQRYTPYINEIGHYSFSIKQPTSKG